MLALLVLATGRHARVGVRTRRNDIGHHALLGSFRRAGVGEFYLDVRINERFPLFCSFPKSIHFFKFI